jgi:hypothetical protein
MSSLQRTIQQFLCCLVKVALSELASSRCTSSGLVGALSQLASSRCTTRGAYVQCKLQRDHNGQTPGVSATPGVVGSAGRRS